MHINGVGRDTFRQAMARLGAAVHVVTTDGRAGRAGFTATAVCSLSDSPPSVLVCMNRGSLQNPVFRANGALCVNVLAQGQLHLAEKFAGLTQESTEVRFAAAEWGETTTGSPALINALVNIDARISQILEVPTHDVMVCQVTEIYLNKPHQPLIYFGRNYHTLPLPESGGGKVGHGSGGIVQPRAE